MVKVSIDGHRIRFEVEGWDQFWSLKSHLELPIAHVRGVRIDPAAARGWWHGIKFPGTNIPGILTAGTFYQTDGAVFYDVHDPDKSIVLDLDHETYKRLVIEVENAAETVAMINAAIGTRTT